MDLAVNEGVGPARIRDVRVLGDGGPVRTWDAAVRALTGDGDPGLVYSSLRRGAVLQAGASRELLMLPDGPRAARFWREAQTRLATVVCSCSVYDECWRADDREDEPQPVRTCEAGAATSFMDRRGARGAP